MTTLSSKQTFSAVREHDKVKLRHSGSRRVAKTEETAPRAGVCCLNPSLRVDQKDKVFELIGRPLPNCGALWISEEQSNRIQCKRDIEEKRMSSRLGAGCGDLTSEPPSYTCTPTAFYLLSNTISSGWIGIQ